MVNKILICLLFLCLLFLLLFLYSCCVISGRISREEETFEEFQKWLDREKYFKNVFK